MSVSMSQPLALRPASRLQHLPVSFFAVVMGLAGLAIAWSRATSVLPWAPAGLGAAIGWLATGVFALLALLYAAKAVLHAGEVRAEFRHPVRLNFFPAVSISLLLLSIVFLRSAPDAARLLWLIGTPLHLGFTLVVMNRWIHHTGIEVAHVNPAWFIPVVGNVLVPVAGVAFYPADLSWFFFAIGIVFWIVLMTIVMYRLFFHAPLPERLTPTLFILVAPPAVGFVAYVNLVDAVDAFAHVLWSTALFLTLLLATNALRFLRLRFFLSSWAYSFPLAAMTIATLAMAHRTGSATYAVLATALLAVLSAVLAALAVRTLLAVARGEICLPD